MNSAVGKPVGRETKSGVPRPAVLTLMMQIKVASALV
jgi:hypothetical protein